MRKCDKCKKKEADRQLKMFEGQFTFDLCQDCYFEIFKLITGKEATPLTWHIKKP